ncbi:MAG: putative N-acyltransferase [Paraglaciecola sp.]|jgi:predicted N-acyltransferase
MLNTLFDFKFISGIEQIEKKQWNKLAESSGPLMQYSFLHALENSGSVSQATGWQPQHMLIYQKNSLIGILPLYIKTHSYGEYVFDFAWANAFKEHGLNYYPKLVSAIPFTPVTGTRLLLTGGLERNEVIRQACEAVQQQAKNLGLSSIHWLFVEQEMSTKLAEHQQLVRRSVQFQWFNRGYQSFTDFLSHFNARKRKSVKSERRKVCNAGIVVKRVSGDDITQQKMDFFYRCYQQTYLKRSGHQGYLTQSFFKKILDSMQQHIMLVIAEHNDTPIASALYLFDENQLCGRYWGALEEADGLHFECCYYQGIEFCIERNIASFNPGTQGEHKISRGFEPVYCYSNHWIKEPAFHDAIDQFLQHETVNIQHYKAGAEKLLPFRQTAAEDEPE